MSTEVSVLREAACLSCYDLLRSDRVVRFTFVMTTAKLLFLFLNWVKGYSLHISFYGYLNLLSSSEYTVSILKPNMARV